MNNIKIIGTTHLVSKEAIEGMIKDYSPDIIGVELCETRYKIFTGELEEAKQKKDKTLLDNITSEIESKAKEENVDYGSDQKAAMFYAIENNIPLILVDKNIIDIQSSMSKIPGEEAMYLQQELVKFQSESLNKQVDENEVIESMRKNIPVTYKILIEDRNNEIAKKIVFNAEKYPRKKILIFLGKSHTKEVERIINDR